MAERTERTKRTERTVPESITCLSPSHPPDHEVVILLFNYPNEQNKLHRSRVRHSSKHWSLKE
jgi:hypothetical protein